MPVYGAGVVLPGASDVLMQVIAPSLDPTPGAYTGKCVMVNPSGLARVLDRPIGNAATSPCDVHNVTGSGASAVHSFIFTTPQAFTPEAGDIAIVCTNSA